MFSPRVWGCTAVGYSLILNISVFPTRVGMYRGDNHNRYRCPRFPHACGDVPDGTKYIWAKDTFSPRVWGCTDDVTISLNEPRRFPHACGDVPTVQERLRHADIVFPTRVGMYREVITMIPTRESFSPRVWGCTVFDAELAWLASRFPHACGDVPRKV